MAQIGSLTRNDDKYIGTIRIMTINGKTQLVLDNVKPGVPASTSDTKRKSNQRN